MWNFNLVGQSFYVRLERRGLKGRIVSPEVERCLDACLLELAAETGNPARIDFDDPDTVLAVETIGDRCGIGVLTRELRARYPFVRVG
jgi:tRNA(Ser,Leu) C12 N-acetylase TAN1